jgi:transcription antitermination factor NusG
MRPPDYEQLRLELIEVSNLLANRRQIQERLHGKPGDPVEVIAGSFEGQRGIVLNPKPRKRVVVVEISFIGARREVELDEELVEKI